MSTYSIYDLKTQLKGEYIDFLSTVSLYDCYGADPSVAAMFRRLHENTPNSEAIAPRYENTLNYDMNFQLLGELSL